MGLLNELESIKYYSVLDLIKNNEAYDKKRNALNGEEVFKLCQERYQSINSMLLPLKKRLGEDIEIIDIGFVHGMQEDTSIFVRYNQNDKQKYITISNLEFNDIEISSSDNRLEKYGFVLSNKKIILEIFNAIYQENLDSELSFRSTSSKFTISDNLRDFSIKDINGKIFSIEGSHSEYAKNGLIYNKEKIHSFYPKLKELLLMEKNILNIYQHVRVYEEDLSKKLIKKTN